MRLSLSISGIVTAAAGVTAGALMLASPAGACEIKTSLCNPGGGSSSGFHITKMPTSTVHYNGPHVTTTVPAGGGSGGSGGNGNNGSNLGPLTMVKFKPSTGDGTEGVLKDQFPKLPNGGNGLVPATPGGAGGPGNDHEPNLLIACRTLDGETDLRFRNIGSAVIPAGSQVRWTVKPTGQHGAILLPREIKVGASVNAHDLLRGAAADGFTCASRLL